MLRDRGEAKGRPRLAAGLALAAAGLIAGLASPGAAQSLPGSPPPMPWPATEVAAAASAVLAEARYTREAEADAASKANQPPVAPIAAANSPPAPAPSEPPAAASPQATPPSAPAPVEEAPAAASPTASAATRPTTAALLDRMCADNMRANEEDRLYSLISLTVRDTMSYNDIHITAPLVDEAVQESLDDLIKECPRIVTTDDAHRLGVVIDTIQGATLARIRDRAGAGRSAAGPGIEETAAERSEAHTLREIDRHLRRPQGRATAADLSQDLSSWEIDAWLDGLPPKERALALFQYASDVTPEEVAHAVGVPVIAVRPDSLLARGQLLSYFREEDDSGTPSLPAPTPAIEYREAGTPLTGLLQASAPEGPAAPVTLSIHGISSELYAGWSLLATVTGLPADKSLDIPGPIVVAAGSGDNERRLIVTRAAEITEPSAPVRRFLLKAYTIDGENGGVGYHDTLHLAADHVDNSEALKTLGNTDLANIEIARCLWHDYGKAPDPGLCR